MNVLGNKVLAARGNGERDRDEEDDAIMVRKAMLGWLEVLFADFVIYYERKY
jgi:hypothetical protein